MTLPKKSDKIPVVKGVVAVIITGCVNILRKLWRILIDQTCVDAGSDYALGTSPGPK